MIRITAEIYDDFPGGETPGGAPLGRPGITIPGGSGGGKVVVHITFDPAKATNQMLTSR